MNVKRREANFVENDIKNYNNAKKFIRNMLKYHKKAKYRYFIVREIKSTEITYLEQLTRMNCIKEELYKHVDSKIITVNEIEALLPFSKELLTLHYDILDKINRWTPQKDTLSEIFMNIESCEKLYFDY